VIKEQTKMLESDEDDEDDEDDEEDRWKKLAE
jgi:hypothetical protein